ncbi:MAG TPA: histone deacetylase [Elusimicrobiota bacterium]|nr:histone deacetylase [Elusimicrobiota bacterium]
MPGSVVFSDPATGGYHTEGHPEAPFRVLKTAERLRAAGLAPRLPPPAREEDALRVHSGEHLRRLAEGDYHDPDTPHYPWIAKLARVSLAGALAAADNALDGTPAFSLMRPPGHHAGRERIAGFCYLNNLAAACARALDLRELKRIAILDVDVHHGDGTESIVLGDERYRFCSLHESPQYPGTGLVSRDNCRNVPLPAGTGEDEYLRRLEPALQDLLDFKPDLLAVSAGFDTFERCPIAGLRLKRGSYRKIGALLAGTKLKRFAVLEGGYAAEVPELVEEFLSGFFS